jgi:very-short-patch-repair endonuclease
MIDGGLTPPAIQHEIIDRSCRTWRVDFAWPQRKVAVEYDGFDWHSDPESLRRDRQKRAALQEVDWAVVSIVFDDVRHRSREMLRRIEVQLRRERAA